MPAVLVSMATRDGEPVRCGSLFSGIAGVDLGFQRAGMETAWFCEYDNHARKVLNRHFPGVPVYEDVTTLDPGTVESVDILSGGFPCQDLSLAGGRAGLAGERSGLFHEFMRIAASLTPRWLLIENVPGLLSSNDGRDMATVTGTLEELGYGWAYRTLNAEFFGVAQRRRRVFIVGCLGDQRGAAEVLFEPESCEGHPPPRRSTREVVTTSLTGSAGGPDDNDAQGGQLVTAPIAFAWQAAGDETSSGAFSKDKSPTLPAGQSLAVAMRWREGKPGGGKGALLSEDRSLTLATANDQTVFVGGAQQDQFVSPNGVAPTLAHSSNHHQGHHQPKVMDGMHVRRLTPTECERLQGFPDGWTDGQPDSTRYRQLGNAVCVNVSEWIGRRLMEVA